MRACGGTDIQDVYKKSVFIRECTEKTTRRGLPPEYMGVVAPECLNSI